jgi:hypothetical protein
MGAMLAITGIFGMAAYSVSKRMRELGIRIRAEDLPHWHRSESVRCSPSAQKNQD